GAVVIRRFGCSPGGGFVGVQPMVFDESVPITLNSPDSAAASDAGRWLVSHVWSASQSPPSQLVVVDQNRVSVTRVGLIGCCGAFARTGTGALSIAAQFEPIGISAISRWASVLAAASAGSAPEPDDAGRLACLPAAEEQAASAATTSAAARSRL